MVPMKPKTLILADQNGTPEAVVEDPEFIALFGRVAADTIAVYKHHHDHVHDAGGDIIPLTGNADQAETPT